MKLILVRHLWGVDATHGLEHYLPRWRDVGYQALEISIRLVPDRPRFLRFLKDHQFQWIPQVPDPAAPEYATHLHAHENWWDQVWQSQRARGLTYSWLTPEFGPPPYLHTLPHTHVPVANLADVCDWMARRQTARFAVS
jgi:hypothetical protein